MSFVDRTYPDIVRDVLTNLTQGVSGEVHRVPAYDRTVRPVRVPDVALERRPVRRVSLVTGTIEGPSPDLEPSPYVFTLNDYELVAAEGDDPSDLSTIRFLPFARLPAPESDLVVNYYPRNADPAPVTDVNVGSVARTLVEALGKELALVYAQLNLAYESAYLETATGASLDRVVALLGLRRFRAGHPVGNVRFGRRPGSVGTISIPAGTPVTDEQDTIRYETVETHTMLAGESTAEVRARGATEATPTVDPDVLKVVQRAIAGIDSVTNERATTRATEDETEDELRTRARTAITAGTSGTVRALENGLLQLPEVRAVSVQEFPNDVPGEVRLSISLADPTRPSLPPSVLARVEALRPAGVRVIPGTASSVALAVRVALVLAGSHLPPSEVEELHGGVRRALVELVRKTGVGARIRTGPLVAALLADERILDASLRLGPKGGSTGDAGADFQPDPDTIVQLAEEDVAFDADSFEQQLPGAAEIPVEVQAVVPATPLTGTPIAAVQSEIDSRLGTYFASLVPSAQVDAPSVLSALRDDTKYQVDALGLQVTLSVDDQFVQVAQGGPAFTVLPGHVFSITTIDVTAPAASPA